MWRIGEMSVYASRSADALPVASQSLDVASPCFVVMVCTPLQATIELAVHDPEAASARR